MNENFAVMLAAGGKSNSLGRVAEVIELVLNDKGRLDELYYCLFDEDAWVRMRAADALEKVCREHPDWLMPYIDKIQKDLAISKQASIQWHMAQIYRQVELTAEQRQIAIDWIKQLLSDKDTDWIVSANAMDTLAHFMEDGFVAGSEAAKLFKIQQNHKSKAVVKRAIKFLSMIP